MVRTEHSAQVRKGRHVAVARAAETSSIPRASWATALQGLGANRGAGHEFLEQGATGEVAAVLANLHICAGWYAEAG